MSIADIEAQASLSRSRLQSLIMDMSARNSTAGLTVEARVLLSDFELQMLDTPA